MMSLVMSILSLKTEHSPQITVHDKALVVASPRASLGSTGMTIRTASLVNTNLEEHQISPGSHEPIPFCLKMSHVRVRWNQLNHFEDNRALAWSLASKSDGRQSRPEVMLVAEGQNQMFTISITLKNPSNVTRWKKLTCVAEMKKKRFFWKRDEDLEAELEDSVRSLVTEVRIFFPWLSS